MLYCHVQQNICPDIWREFVKDDSQISPSHLTCHIWEQNQHFLSLVLTFLVLTLFLFDKSLCGFSDFLSLFVTLPFRNDFASFLVNDYMIKESLWLKLRFAFSCQQCLEKKKSCFCFCNCFEKQL